MLRDVGTEGIETVFQTLALADEFDVPDNLFLGREKTLFNLGPFSILDYRGMRQATLAGLEKTAVKIPNVRKTIRNMSGGQRQCVAIARTAWMLGPGSGVMAGSIVDFDQNVAGSCPEWRGVNA